MKVDERRRRRIGLALFCLFALALVMGPGPGIYLVNPGIEEANSRTVLGMPVIYVWTVFWCSVQAAVVVVSYFTVWKEQKK